MPGRNVRDLRAVVIGLGGMGRRHLAALDAAEVRVAGVCDMNLAVAQELAASRPDRPLAAGDWRELLPGADLVCIATNGPSHHEMVLAAAEAKVPYVLCEKPMGTSGAKTREMAAACEAAGTRLAVNLCRRFLTRCLLFRQAVRDARSIGRPRRFWGLIGGGGVGCVGLHYFDYAAWLFDARPVWVSAELTESPAPNVRGAQFCDPGGQVSVGFACADGWRFTGDFELSEDVPRASRCLVVGTEGVAEFDDFTPSPAGSASASARPANQRHTAKTRLVQPEPVALEHGPALDIVQATRDCILDLLGPHAHPTVDAGIESVDVVLGAHLSSRQGGARVPLPLKGAGLALDVAIT
ncbi:MAG: Gfo/Idh/MocA family oxidoreductase [Proteobacteria bacterium]|nr:Gfo/Idh/MocA family oxidoreductase [Pseudomonadota bacterium]MBU1596405.1 Gfo/Idh/MocA family oxidoreductase [Pseudomonadota bacterium]